MSIMEYINAAVEKGSIGAYISLGIFALIGICAVLGVYFGATRGFSKAVIRIFTVGASAACALFGVKWISKMIVQHAEKVSDGGANSLEDILNAYFPQLIESIPEMMRPIIAEIDSETATIFVMMIIAMILSPVLFIAIFQLLKFVSVFLYNLLSGLAGAISYGKGVVSTILGAVVGLLQGAVIAAVMIFPISGLCSIALEAREPLLGNTENPNEYIAEAYANVIDDLATNPVLHIVNQYGGKGLYEDMITVKVNGEKMYMGEKCIGAIKTVADVMPFANQNFDWKNPTVDERQALQQTVNNIGDDELVAELVSDIMRGMAKSIQNDSIDLGLTGATDALVYDVMDMFATSSAETIEGDLDVVVDVYLIMCDHDLHGAFSDAKHVDIRALLTKKDADGNTTATLITNRLKEYDRAHPIITSFTKISLSVMHGSENFDEKADELYDNVKDDITSALSHNKSDYESEEEYRNAVSNDLDTAFEENNINVDDAVKEDMIDYISENYGDHEGEITDIEINDALLSYYEAYAKATESGTEE